MYITRKDVKRILEVMDDFPEAKTYKLECDSSSGIGNIVSLTMQVDVKNYNACVKIELSGVEDW